MERIQQVLWNYYNYTLVFLDIPHPFPSSPTLEDRSDRKSRVSSPASPRFYNQTLLLRRLLLMINAMKMQKEFYCKTNSRLHCWVLLFSIFFFSIWLFLTAMHCTAPLLRSPALLPFQVIYRSQITVMHPINPLCNYAHYYSCLLATSFQILQMLHFYLSVLLSSWPSRLFYFQYAMRSDQNHRVSETLPLPYYSSGNLCCVFFFFFFFSVASWPAFPLPSSNNSSSSKRQLNKSTRSQFMN